MSDVPLDEPEDTLKRLTEPRTRIVGMSGAYVARDEVVFFVYGSSGDPKINLDEHTLFEIGSITKVFTAILLAALVADESVSLDDPVEKYLLDANDTPRNVSKITLQQLATHTAGLPRLAPNWKKSESFEEANPYAHYREQDLIEGLRETTLTGELGESVSYSNYGFMLLAYVLGRAVGREYEGLVLERICRPLGLDDTSFTLNSEQESRFVPGHDEWGGKVPHWTDAISGAGGLRSSSSDMTKFLKANLSPESTPLEKILLEARQPRVVQNEQNSIALGWNRLTHEGLELDWHNGGTGGFGSLIGLEQNKKQAIVLLSNSTHDPAMDSEGFHSLIRRCREAE